MGKSNEYECEKNFPTFDIFDKVSLKTWGNLRKILFDYGKKFYVRDNFNMSFALAIYFFFFVI